jgi:hypothetical protein
MSFDDYWHPFLAGVGPASSYNMSLKQKDRQRIEKKLREALPLSEDGSIALIARA